MMLPLNAPFWLVLPLPLLPIGVLLPLPNHQPSSLLLSANAVGASEIRPKPAAPAMAQMPQVRFSLVRAAWDLSVITHFVNSFVNSVFLCGSDVLAWPVDQRTLSNAAVCSHVIRTSQWPSVASCSRPNSLRERTFSITTGRGLDAAS